MSYKDTLTLYEELIASGKPDGEAKTQAHQLGALGSAVVNTCNEIKEQLNKMDSKIDSKIDQLRSDMNLSNAELKADMNLIKTDLKSDMNLIKLDMQWIRRIGYTTIALFIGNIIRSFVWH
jgi:hypothetical protein